MQCERTDRNLTPVIVFICPMFNYQMFAVLLLLHFKCSQYSGAACCGCWTVVIVVFIQYLRFCFHGPTHVKTDRKWKFQFRSKPKVTPKAGIRLSAETEIHQKRPPAFGRNPKLKPKVHATYQYTHVSGCGPE